VWTCALCGVSAENEHWHWPPDGWRKFSLSEGLRDYDQFVVCPDCGGQHKEKTLPDWFRYFFRKIVS